MARISRFRKSGPLRSGEFFIGGFAPSAELLSRREKFSAGSALETIILWPGVRLNRPPGLFSGLRSRNFDPGTMPVCRTKRADMRHPPLQFRPEPISSSLFHGEEMNLWRGVGKNSTLPFARGCSPDPLGCGRPEEPVQFRMLLTVSVLKAGNRKSKDLFPELRSPFVFCRKSFRIRKSRARSSPIRSVDLFEEERHRICNEFEIRSDWFFEEIAKPLHFV